MTRAERVRALLDEYARQRYENEREQRQREREAFSRDPELEKLRARGIELAAGSGAFGGLSGGALPLPHLPRHGLCGRRAGALLRLF